MGSRWGTISSLGILSDERWILPMSHITPLSARPHAKAEALGSWAGITSQSDSSSSVVVRGSSGRNSGVNFRAPHIVAAEPCFLRGSFWALLLHRYGLDVGIPFIGHIPDAREMCALKLSPRAFKIHELVVNLVWCSRTRDILMSKRSHRSITLG